MPRDAGGLRTVEDWWRSAVIYQVYPRSFRDSNGDGVGDLDGITEKLDYIASLGVDAVWLSPFYVSPMRDFGYDVADHCDVDPVFGTLQDFDRLVARATALGLKVIVDLVCGHTSDQHAWFRASRAGRDGDMADWYVWADARPDGTPPNNWLSVFGGAAWRWEPRRRQYYLHHFLDSQPALNLRNPAVVDALLEVARFWLDRGVAGFRMDAVDFLLHDPGLRDNPAKPAPPGGPPLKPFALQHHLHDMAQPGVPALLARFRALTDSYPGAVLLGEVSSQEAPFARITRYTVPGQGLHIAYTLRPLRGASVTAAIADAFREIDALPTEPAVCWCFSNHDVERVASRWNPACEPDAAPDADFVRSMLALLLSLGGAVCLFQGEELGLPEAEIAPADLRDPFGIAYFPEFRGRDGSRTPMPWRSDEVHAGFTSGDRPWLPIPAEHRAVSVADQERDPGSLLNACRGLIAWRKAHPVLMQGGLRPLRLPEPLIGFERALGAVRFLCLFNPSQDTVHLPLDRYPDMEALTGHELGVSISGATAILRPFGVLVASAGRAAAPQVRSRLVRCRCGTPRRVAQGRRPAVRTRTGACPCGSASVPITDARRRVFFGPLSDTAPAAPGLDTTKPSKRMA